MNHYFFENLKNGWYFLILFWIFCFNYFYKYWYESEHFFVGFEVLNYYVEKGFDTWPLHLYISVFLLLSFIFLTLFYNPFISLYENTLPHGNAKFASLSNLRKSSKEDGLLKIVSNSKSDSLNGGIVLCKAFGKYIIINSPVSALLLAPPGTGKSAGLAIPTLFMNRGSVVVLDIKKELFETTSKHRASFSNVLVFEPTSDNTSRWNPLDKKLLPKNESEKFVVVQRIASILYQNEDKEGGGGKKDFFTLKARELFLRIALALIAKNGGTSIPEIYKATLGSNRQETISKLSEIKGLDETTYKFLIGLPKVYEGEFSGGIGTFDTALQAFQDPRIEYAVSSSDFSYSDLRMMNQKPTSFYLVIRADDVDRLSGLIRLFFESVSLYFLSQKWEKENEPIITFLLDEFIRLGKLNSIVENPALSRGVGLNSLFIAQATGQVEKIYGRTGREELISCTAFKVVPSINNEETAEIISKSIGYKTETVRSVSNNSNHLIAKNYTYSQQAKRLISPQKLMSQKPFECIVTRQFHQQNPIQGKLIKWWESKNFKKLSGMALESEIFRYEPLTPKTMNEEQLEEVLLNDYLVSNEDTNMLDNLEDSNQDSFLESNTNKKEIKEDNESMDILSIIDEADRLSSLKDERD